MKGALVRFAKFEAEFISIVLGLSWDFGMFALLNHYQPTKIKIDFFLQQILYFLHFSLLVTKYPLSWKQA